MTKRIVKLSDIAEINPKRPKIEREDDTLTSFIPMECISDILGEVSQVYDRPYSDVKKGYTYFENNDVIFAKINPCMQNGKHAIVHGLDDGFGFGSTEYHVIRALDEVLPEWIHYYLRRSEVLYEAEQTFTGTVGQQRVPAIFLENLEIPLAPLSHQLKATKLVSAQLSEVNKSRKALENQIEETISLANAIISNSIKNSITTKTTLSEVIQEIKTGIGEGWQKYPVLGATREGLFPAREPPGKNPQRYKPVTHETVFYNPMRIMIGSIAFVDNDDVEGITSPDYVVLKGIENKVHSRWFYYWLRSPLGEQCIQSLARGAVRERMLFNRLKEGEIDLPDYETQSKAADALSKIIPMKQQLKKQLADIEALQPKILSKAFEF